MSNKPLTIKQIELFLIGDNEVERVRHTGAMGEIYAGTGICRIKTEDGFQGIGGTLCYSETKFNTCIVEAAELFVPGLIGKSALDREATTSWMFGRPNDIGGPAVSIVDIAMWDLLGQYTKLPIYQLLGAARDRIESYASTPFMKTIPEYIDYVNLVLNKGFKAVKFHCTGVFEKDMLLVKTINEHFAGKANFMLDLECQYNRYEAMKMSKLLEAFGWFWLEAPLPDRDYAGYRYLRNHSTMPVIGSGTKINTLSDINNGLLSGAWSSLRSDVTTCGGFTEMKKICALAEANDMQCEIQSWGPTLTQAAALQMMLACKNCTYFEQAYPYEPFEVAVKNVIRTDKDGFVHAPKGNNGYGLGIEMDWDKVENLTLSKYDSSK